MNPSMEKTPKPATKLVPLLSRQSQKQSLEDVERWKSRCLTDTPLNRDFFKKVRWFTEYQSGLTFPAAGWNQFLAAREKQKKQQTLSRAKCGPLHMQRLTKVCALGSHLSCCQKADILPSIVTRYKCHVRQITFRASATYTVHPDSLTMAISFHFSQFSSPTVDIHTSHFPFMSQFLLKHLTFGSVLGMKNLNQI